METHIEHNQTSSTLIKATLAELRVRSGEYVCVVPILKFYVELLLAPELHSTQQNKTTHL